MTTDDTVEKTITTYRESLIMALRLKDVPGDRIGQIVAEVESHVADTGESPTEAFGTPRDYATHLTAGHRRDPWWHTALGALLAGIAGWFLAQGALSILLGETYLGQPGWLWLALGLIIAVPAGVTVYRRSTRVRDPRTGADMVPPLRWGLAALIGLPIAIVLIAWGLIEMFGTNN